MLASFNKNLQKFWLTIEALFLLVLLYHLNLTKKNYNTNLEKLIAEAENYFTENYQTENSNRQILEFLGKKINGTSIVTIEVD